MKETNEAVRTHCGMITYLDKDKVPTNTFYAECCSGIRYTTGKEPNQQYIVVHIPMEALQALGKGPFELLAWVEYLTKIGLPCYMDSVKPEAATLFEKTHKTAKAFIDQANYSMFYYNKALKTKRPLITKDLFYKVIIPLSEYHSKGKAFWQFVTWTLIRYFYSNGYCNIIDYTFMFKALYPALDRVKCLMLAHAGIHTAHHEYSTMGATGSSYDVYYAYHGLVTPMSNLLFMSQKTFTARLKEKACAGTFVNSFSTMVANDGRDVHKLFDEGKFDELYKLALKDE